MALDHKQILMLSEEAAAAGLAGQRSALLLGLPEGYIASLPLENTLSVQITSDLARLNEGPLLDGRDPLHIWLTNAIALARVRQSNRLLAVFQSVLTQVEGSPPSADPPASASSTSAPQSYLSIPMATPSETLPSIRVGSPDIPEVPISMPVSSHPVYRAGSHLQPLPAPPRYAQHSFVGREEEIALLKEALVLPTGANQTGPRVAAVCGIGGMGKTALAQVFAERYGGFFPGGVLWGDFGSDDRARAVLEIEIGRWEENLGIAAPGAADSTPKRRNDRLKKILSERVRQLGSCLVILDNVDSHKTLDTLLEMLVASSVLVTTRKRDLVQKERFALVELGGLNPEESKRYLREAVGPDASQAQLAAAQLASEHVDHHPLSLRVIAATVRANPAAGPFQLVRKLARRVRDSLVPADNLSVQVPMNIMECFHEAVSRLQPRHRSFLVAMASQHVGSWSVESADYISGMNDEGETRSLLADLQQQGLIDLLQKEGRYKLHRALRTYLRAVYGHEAPFGLLPRTWEIPSLAPILSTIAPWVTAGEAVYDLRQEQWAMQFVQAHRGDLVQLRREWGAILLGLRRRAERGFGAAARHRLEMLKDVLPLADLSGLTLETAVLDGTDLTRVHLQRANLSGEPLRAWPTRKRAREALWAALRGTFSFALALLASFVIYYLRRSDLPDLRWAVVLPAPFVGAMGPCAALVLSVGPAQRHLDRRSMMWRYAVERATEIVLFFLAGILVILPIAIWKDRPGLIATFALTTAQFAVPFAFVSWLTFRLTRWAGRRFTLGGLATRVLSGLSMAFLVFLSPLAAGGLVTLPDPDLLSSLPLIVFAMFAGMLPSPERHLLTSLRTSYLRNANLRGADLSGANLDHVQLAGAVLHNAEMEGASLVGAGLDGAKLEGVNLAGARLEGASLRNVDLVAADLTKAKLHGADLSGAKLARATLAQIEFDEQTRWPQGVRVSAGSEVIVADRISTTEVAEVA